MRKTYKKPLLQLIPINTEEMLCTSNLTGNGDVNTGITPSDDIFDGVFQSNAESDHSNIWN